MTMDIVVIPIVGLAAYFVFRHMRKTSSGGGCDCNGCDSAQNCASFKPPADAGPNDIKQ